MTAGLTPTFLYMLGGLVLWGLRFLAVYSFTAIACSRGWHEHQLAGIGAVQLGIGLITIACVVAAAAILAAAASSLRADPPDAENTRFIDTIAASVAALAILAMLWETLPVLIIPICA